MYNISDVYSHQILIFSKIVMINDAMVHCFDKKFDNDIYYIMIPDNMVAVDVEAAGKVEKLIDKLEDDDDIQSVYHNADFPDEFEG